MKKFPSISLISVITLLLFSCNSAPERVENLAPNAHQVVAAEVIQTSKYTYVYVVEEPDEYWIAINKAPIEEGKTYFWSLGSEMRDFTGSELNRTFESIYFIQDFTDQPITPETIHNPMMSSERGGKPVLEEKEDIAIELPEGAIAIADLYENRDKYNGKKVTVRGEVVKISPEIMNRNWVHIQDGTKDAAGNYDLTITTDAFVNPGDVVTFEGNVAIDRDFGSGYFYPLIIEEAVVK
jgi:hypothetical protein